MPSVGGEKRFANDVAKRALRHPAHTLRSRILSTSLARSFSLTLESGIETNYFPDSCASQYVSKSNGHEMSI